MSVKTVTHYSLILECDYCHRTAWTTIHNVSDEKLVASETDKFRERKGWVQVKEDNEVIDLCKGCFKEMTEPDQGSQNTQHKMIKDFT
jgi:hypothetical protein